MIRAEQIGARFSMLVLLSGLFGARGAIAQEPSRPEEGAEPSSVEEGAELKAEAPSETELQQPGMDELIEELVTGDEEDEDLTWLYSSKIYEPSRLGGRPVTAPPIPEAAQGLPRTWSPDWRRFSTVDFWLTGAFVAGAVAGELVPAGGGRWHSRNEVDEWVRDRVGVEDVDRGTPARDASDLLMSLNMSFPFLVDSLVVTSWYRASPDVAQQMALINAQAMAFSSMLQGMMAGLSGRARPYVRNCGDTLDAEHSACTSRRRFRSFFSGHTSMSFAGAASTCTNHIYHDVFDGGVVDGVTCALAMTSAAAVGTFRVISDQHYFSDVLVGAAIGSLGGFGVPWLLHYGPLWKAKGGPTAGASFALIPFPNGMAAGGRF